MTFLCFKFMNFHHAHKTPKANCASELLIYAFLLSVFCTLFFFIAKLRLLKHGNFPFERIFANKLYIKKAQIS